MSLLDQILMQLQPGEFATGTGNAAMQPETPAVTAPVPGAGPSVPVSPTAAPVAAKHGGVLGALGRIFTPEAGTFWDSAWKNGIYGARSGQQEYQTAQTRQALGDQALAAKTRIDNAKADHELNAPTIAGNNVVVNDPTAPGGVRFIAPDPQPDKVTRLIDQWHEARKNGDKLTMSLLERAIGGAQYSPEVIEAMGNARTKTVVAGKRAQRFAPKSGRSTSDKPPAGFTLNP
jgi:hypothetical protein